MKGQMLNQYQVGNRVTFRLGMNPEARGTISKLHKSTVSGSAEIRVDGGKKVTRRLHLIRKGG